MFFIDHRAFFFNHIFELFYISSHSIDSHFTSSYKLVLLKSLDSVFSRFSQSGLDKPGQGKKDCLKVYNWTQTVLHVIFHLLITYLSLIIFFVIIYHSNS